jgi:hypothetical protein
MWNGKYRQSNSTFLFFILFLCQNAQSIIFGQCKTYHIILYWKIYYTRNLHDYYALRYIVVYFWFDNLNIFFPQGNWCVEQFELEHGGTNMLRLSQCNNKSPTSSATQCWTWRYKCLELRLVLYMSLLQGQKTITSLGRLYLFILG